MTGVSFPSQGRLCGLRLIFVSLALIIRAVVGLGWSSRVVDLHLLGFVVWVQLAGPGSSSECRASRLPRHRHHPWPNGHTPALRIRRTNTGPQERGQLARGSALGCRCALAGNGSGLGPGPHRLPPVRQLPGRRDRGAFTNSVFGMGRAAVLTGAIATAATTSGAAATTTAPTMVAGYTAAQAATYAWVSQGLITPIHVFIRNDLAQRVRTGAIAVDLARPVDLQLGWLAADLGRAAYTLLPRGLPPVLIGAFTTGLLLPHHALPYVLGAASLALAVGISFACRFLVM